MKNIRISILTRTLALAAVMLAACAHSARAMYDPTTYNPDAPTFVNDNFTPAQKDAQRAAGAAMMDALVKAAKAGAGAKSYTIKPGTYRVKIATYRLDNIAHFTINCPNVNIWLDIEPSYPQQLDFTWINFKGCSNIKILGGNTNFDSERLQFEQATITGINPAAGTLDVKVMPGYDAQNFPAQTEGNMSWTFNRQGICLTRPSYSAVENLDAKDITRKRLTIGAKFFADGTGKRLKIGDIFFTRYNLQNWSAVISSDRSNTDFEIAGINSWYGPMWAIDSTRGSFICRDCSNYRRPGTNRVGASAEPPIYGNMHTLVWQNCTTGGPGQDDGIDVVGSYALVGESNGPRTLTLASDYQIGDTLYFYDPVTFAPEGAAKVVSTAPLTDTAHAAELAVAVNKDQESRGARWRYDANQKFWTVTLDKDLAIRQFSGYDTDLTSPDVTITGSYFADMNSQALFVKGHHITVTGNRIDRGNATAIHAQISRYWSEGPVPQNVTISNNIVNDNPNSYGAPNGMWDWAVSSIGVEVEGANSGVGAIRNVRIENNRINGSARLPIMVKNVDGAIIRNNVITAPILTAIVNKPPLGPNLDLLYKLKPDGAIFVAASKNVELSGNTLKSPTPFCPNLLQFGPYNELKTFSGKDFLATKTAVQLSGKAR